MHFDLFIGNAIAHKFVCEAPTPLRSTGGDDEKVQQILVPSAFCFENFSPLGFRSSLALSFRATRLSALGFRT